MKKLNFIDLFSGAGGLSCGLELAGHKCLLGVDSNKHAIETFIQNHPHAEGFCGDIRKLSKEMIATLSGNQKIDMVVGGPPCQGFSTVGKGDPNDSRNHLFLEFVRIVKITRPDFIIIENVTGLIAKKNENTLNSIIKEFTRLKYELGIKVLDAKDYGVPEHRRRTIIIGNRIGVQPIFPKVTHKTAVTVAEVIYDLKCKNGVIYNHELTTAKLKSKLDEERLKRIPAGKGIRYKKDEEMYLPKALRLNINWETIPEKRLRQTRYQRVDANGPAPTIMTHRHGYYHPKENRYLTPREAAKIQSFPNNFIFKGPLSSQWRQIGNAVPPMLGKALGVAIRNMAQAKPTQNSKKSLRLDQKAIYAIRERAFCYDSPPL